MIVYLNKFYLESERNGTNTITHKHATVTHVSQESGIFAQFLSLQSGSFFFKIYLFKRVHAHRSTCACV